MAMTDTPGDGPSCVMVLGASSGIGRATCRAFAAAGTTVVAVARRMARLHDLNAETAATARHLRPFAADVSDPAVVRQVFDQAAAEFGRVTCVVHTVGFAFPIGFLADQDVETIDQSVRALVGSAATATAVALRAMRGAGGTVLLVSSGAATGATPGRSLYAASKAAVNAFIRSVSLEVAAWDGPAVGVAGVLPGRVDTPMQRELMLAANTAPEVFRLERFRDESELRDPVAVGGAIVELSARDSAELNGHLFRYHPDGWVAQAP
jgi:NAD(P)-dependent dehydrogenase (short-subunit alcohol dehydrogenase family)